MLDLINLDVPALELRLVTECGACGLQYGSPERSPGDRFHCVCGSVLTVPDAPPHDSAVVFCSTCGTPREPGAGSCTNCSRALTPQREHLHTICPQCATRIEDAALFCHSCAKKIDVVKEELGKTEMPCADCPAPTWVLERKVFPPRPSKRKGQAGRSEEAGIVFFECSQCVGMWFETEPFRELEAQAPSFEKDDNRTPSPPAPPGGPDKPRRTCLRCEDVLERSIYDLSSGVEFDICRKHGVWLDEGELAGIVHWVQTRPPGWQRAGEVPERLESWIPADLDPDLFDQVDFALDVLVGVFELLAELND